MKTTLVTTTIHVPHLLRAYAENAARNGHQALDFVVVGDKKTPKEARALCDEVARRFPCAFVDVAEQEDFLRPYGGLAEHIPYNCIQRRNVGLLMAYANGADVVVTIDDDNFVLQGDYIGAQQIVGSQRLLPTWHSTSGWVNVCAALATDDAVPIYHRGYPHLQRWREQDAFFTRAPEQRRCVVNAGFWLDDPDIGALDRLQRQPTVRGLKANMPARFFLGQGTWSPFNSQNTALASEVIPAYFLSPYVGRYDDIWASYVVARIADHLDAAICFGEPWVRQARNPHDLMRDFAQEQDGMRLTDGFCAALRTMPLRGQSWASCFLEIAEQLEESWQLGAQANDHTQTLVARYVAGMRLWHAACDRAHSQRTTCVGAQGDGALRTAPARTAAQGQDSQGALAM